MPLLGGMAAAVMKLSIASYLAHDLMLSQLLTVDRERYTVGRDFIPL